MLPLKIGAALMIDSIDSHRDWLYTDNRDLEIQDFFRPDVYLNGWRETVDRALAAIDGFEGRLGIHAPFYGLDIANPDPEMAEVVGRRYLAAVEASAALGARQMVIHSPFDNWHHFNRFNQFGDRDLPDMVAEHTRTVLAKALALAETEGVTLVVENIKDITPEIRRDMIERIGSSALALSIDTGHAHIAGRASGAPPVDIYVRDAGNALRHVHLQDTDGYADRHWAPGEGGIDWDEVFRALAKCQSQPHLVLELRRHEEIPQGFAYLRDRGLVI